jgi:hypothetical protein
MAGSLSLHSEMFQPEGGAGGDAARRALGRPRLDRLSVLVREAVQNSWDARRISGKRSSSIDFIARLENIAADELAALKSRVFTRHPKEHPLNEYLSRSGIDRLVFEDRGTVGLGGPVFKTRRDDPDESRNFVRFFRDIGRDPYAAAGGGTYGYGKSVFFNASAAATIIVYTRFETPRGSLQERLMAMSLWQASRDETHTGRHWWGVKDEDHPRSMAPASGALARDIAEAIGFKGFDRESTGTSIMILGPQLGEGLDADPLLAAKRISETMMIWYWPRMLGGADGLGRIKFKTFVNTKPVVVPDPESTPPFNIYSTALKNLARRRLEEIVPPEPNKVIQIRSERPRARLGWLSLSLATRSHRGEWSVTSIGDHPMAEQLKEEVGAPARSNHVALIRAPGQVIRYLRTRAYPDLRLEYAGLFVLDTDSEEAEREFIQSEPPSHDDWRPPYLGVNARSFVRIALNHIRAESDRFTEAGRVKIETSGQDALGPISADLGQLLSAPGTGARRQPKSGGGSRGGGGSGGSSQGGPRIKLEGIGRLDQHAGSRVFILPFRVDGEVSTKGLRITANPRVIVAGGAVERDAPTDASVPRVLGWQSRSDGAKLVRTAELKLKSTDAREWEVVVTVPSDAMVGVSLSSESAGDGSGGAGR